MYELRTACCQTDPHNIAVDVEVHGTAWKDIRVYFDDRTGDFNYEEDFHLNDVDCFDSDVTGYTCSDCGRTHFSVEDALEVISVDEDGETIEQGRYWCDYCDWTGNHIEDHQLGDCDFKLSGPRNV